jgi:hypothetical protein
MIPARQPQPDCIHYALCCSAQIQNASGCLGKKDCKFYAVHTSAPAPASDNGDTHYHYENQQFRLVTAKELNILVYNGNQSERYGISKVVKRESIQKQRELLVTAEAAKAAREQENKRVRNGIADRIIEFVNEHRHKDRDGVDVVDQVWIEYFERSLRPQQGAEQPKEQP